MVWSIEDIGCDSMNAMDSFKLMLDEHSSEILSMTEVQAMNATEISEALGIPIAACYRRIRLLKQAGMIREEDKAV
ncbi:MAG: ArsR family transcriptional regulator, partial [Methanomassiliicoccus sp.]